MWNKVHFTIISKVWICKMDTGSTYQAIYSQLIKPRAVLNWRFMIPLCGLIKTGFWTVISITLLLSIYWTLIWCSRIMQSAISQELTQSWSSKDKRMNYQCGQITLKILLTSAKEVLSLFFRLDGSASISIHLYI